MTESAQTTVPWMLITVDQLKKGWMELRGVTPIHHAYQVIAVIQHDPDDEPVYKVRSPELWMLEQPDGRREDPVRRERHSDGNARRLSNL